MKCKYMITNDVVCICECEGRNTENEEQQCKQTRQLVFNFEKFCKENMLSEEKYGHIDLYCRVTER